MNAEGIKTILLVEDEILVALSEKRDLERYNYLVLHASNGDEAIEIFASNPGIDLVLMDIDLGPGIDGPETSLRILQERDIPIIFLSGHVDPEIVEKTEKIISYGYVVKNSGITVLDVSIKTAFKLFSANLTNQLSANMEFNHLQSLAHIGNWRFELNEKYFTASEECLRIFGFLPYAKPTFDDVKDRIVEKSKGEALEIFERAVTTGNSYNIELDIIIKDTGEQRTIVTNAKVQFDENGFPAAVIGTSQDITDRKRAELTLWEYGEIYRSILNASPDDITITDMHGRIVMVSPAALTMFRCGEDDLIGRSVVDFVEEKDRERAQKNIGKLENGKTLSPGEYSAQRLDGTVFEIEVNGKNIFGENGQPTHMVFIIRDISERKTNEREMRMANEQLRILSIAIEQSPVTTVLTDLDGTIQFVNPKFTDMTGYSANEVIGQNPRILKDPEKKSDEYKELWDTILAGKNWQGVFHNKKKNGELYWESAVISPVKNNDGTIAHFLALKEDITERKIAEEKINHLLAEKELILREVHHRIKNNMNTIYGLLLLQASTLPDSAAVQALEDSANRVRSMMMLYTKLYQASDTTEISIAQYLPYLLDEIIKNFPNSKNVTTVKDVEDFILNVRKLQPLGIIINELVTNIMKYAFQGKEGGEIYLTAKKNKHLVEVSISDNGNGMPESVSFEKSTGFGLVLVAGLIKQIDGTIRIERDRGTKIIMEFPV